MAIWWYQSSPFITRAVKCICQSDHENDCYRDDHYDDTECDDDINEQAITNIDTKQFSIGLVMRTLCTYC